MSTSVLQSENELAEVCKLLGSGAVVRPELRDRIDQDANRIRDEIRNKHGTLDIAVELIREARDGA